MMAMMMILVRYPLGRNGIYEILNSDPLYEMRMRNPLNVLYQTVVTLESLDERIFVGREETGDCCES